MTFVENDFSKAQSFDSMVEMYESKIKNLEDALNLALCWLIKNEPPDSRAVSNEFVAMACIHMDHGIDANGQSMPIIDAALEIERKKNV